jgi:1-aminocyclopropane-1-carboxylate synthase
MGNLAHVHTVEVRPISIHHGESISCDLSVSSLDAAFDRGVISGCRFKALLLTNPSNPIGSLYRSSDILAAIAWARSKGLHVIVDEIYALSTFSTDSPSFEAAVHDDSFPRSFESVVALLDNNLQDDVHVLWSLSKDFGGSGLRCGAMYSQSRGLLKAMAGLNDAFQVSNWIQQCVAHVLSDTSFIDSYIAMNRRVLRDSYLFLRQSLKQLNIPLVGRLAGAVSGIFVFADFRRYLSEDSFEGEMSFFDEMVKRGVVMTPGKACHSQVPGFFRICYAWVPREGLEEAIRRIKQYIEDKFPDQKHTDNGV